MKINRILILYGLFALTGCGDNNKEQQDIVEESPTVVVPTFNEDSAYFYVQQQVNIGPRVPNTPEHTITGDFLVDALENFGGKVQEQKFEALTFDGVNLSLRNIIASFNPEAVKRILLAAHWDTRPYADKDIIEPNIPIDGANDGASGVGVLLEIARNISIVQPNVGIDIVLFDGEDWGEYHDAVNVPKPKGFDTWWALGSQYWSKNNGNYRAYYGILLDMVGARGSQFHMEGISMNYAPKIVKKVWDKASEIGYGNYFIHQNQHEITDDHFFVNRDAKIPMIDIVHYDPAVGYFGDYHHTHRDNMELIDKRTLKAVGQTLLQVIYNE